MACLEECMEKALPGDAPLEVPHFDSALPAGWLDGRNGHSPWPNGRALPRRSPASDGLLPLVVPLVGVGSTSTELVGGKAAQLAVLTSLGLPVPAAFFVTTAAYWRFLSAAGLDRWLADALGRLSPRDLRGVVGLAAEVRERFSAHPLPDELAEAVRQSYEELLGGDERTPVAVRSSASVEDGRVASFAGQCESLLNVRGTASLLRAVVTCWASLHSEQALLYRARHGLLGSECAAAVVVQHLVLADRAAVAFSANPVDGDLSRVVVNASWGLGEAIVSGLVDPDYYVVSKRDFAVLDRQIADKQLMTVMLPEGGTAEVPVPGDRRRVSSLSDGEVQELARMAVHLESARGHPVDVEFAYQGPRLAVLQCRPITTL